MEELERVKAHLYPTLRVFMKTIKILALGF
jgi:hypothetical protein